MNQLTTTTKRVKLKDTEYVQSLTIKRRGEGDLILPLDADQDKRFLQLSAAEFSGTLRDYIKDVIETKIRDKELTPLQMKQLGECKEIEQKLHITAWGPSGGEGGGKNAGDDEMAMIAMAVTAGAELQKQTAAAKERAKPIETEAEDVGDE